MRKIEDDTNRWKNIKCSWTEGINIVKVTILPEAVHRFSAIVIKLQIAFFTDPEQNFLICMQIQKTPNSQSNLEKEEWSWRNQSSYFRLYYKAAVIKTVWYRHKDGNIDQ